MGLLTPKLQRYCEVVKYPLIDLSFGLQHRFDPKIRLVDVNKGQKFIVNGLMSIESIGIDFGTVRGIGIGIGLAKLVLSVSAPECYIDPIQIQASH